MAVNRVTRASFSVWRRVLALVFRQGKLGIPGIFWGSGISLFVVRGTRPPSLLFHESTLQSNSTSWQAARRCRNVTLIK